MDVSDIKKSLEDPNISILLTYGFGDKSFLIGAPHHTPGGTGQMPCGRPGDENTGFLALSLGEHLEGHCIIASNYWLNPNKTCNDYLIFIKQKQPNFLIEIHGHGGKDKSAIFDIEISCGTEILSEKSEKLASYIHDEMQKNSGFDGITVSGKFRDIYFKAEQTLSLKCARDCKIIPYHIEISPKFRIDENNKVPDDGKELMKIIANSLKKMEGT